MPRTCNFPCNHGYNLKSTSSTLPQDSSFEGYLDRSSLDAQLLQLLGEALEKKSLQRSSQLLTNSHDRYPPVLIITLFQHFLGINGRRVFV